MSRAAEPPQSRPSAAGAVGALPLAPRARSQDHAWLRVYLGYAPGVGKTYAMLHEGRRRMERGTDVVVGWVETYERPQTVEAIGDLEVIPRRLSRHQRIVYEELDTTAVLLRQPQVVLIDELAHTNAPGSRHEKRYEDVRTLQEAGINVISTVNVQNLESLAEPVFQLTGLRVHDTLPDWVLDEADEVELIDQTPEALQKRMQHGNVYPATRIDAALRGLFRTSNLAALRAMALQRVVAHTDARLRASLQGPEGENPWRLARIRAALQRLPPSGEPQRFHFGEVAVDLAAHVVTVRGSEVHLTPTEYEVLKELVLQAGRVVTHHTLLQRVWGPAHTSETEYLRPIINALRKKLGPQLIQTEPTIGYRLCAPTPPARIIES